MIGKDIEFDLCISVDELLEFIRLNTTHEWNDICDMEYKYRKSSNFEDDRTYPIVIIGEEDETKFHYWCEKFVEYYKEEIDGRTVYIIRD